MRVTLILETCGAKIVINYFCRSNDRYIGLGDFFVFFFFQVKVLKFVPAQF